MVIFINNKRFLSLFLCISLVLSALSEPKPVDKPLSYLGKNFGRAALAIAVYKGFQKYPLFASAVIILASVDMAHDILSNLKEKNKQNDITNNYLNSYFKMLLEYEFNENIENAEREKIENAILKNRNFKTNLSLQDLLVHLETIFDFTHQSKAYQKAVFETCIKYNIFDKSNLYNK